MKRTFLKAIILATVFFTSCVSTKTFLKKDQIPEGFGKGNKTILIIPSPYDKVNKAVEDAFEKYYKGKYEIGGKTKKGVKDLAYTFNTYSDYNPGGFVAGGHQAASTDIYYGVTDLKTNKTYKMLRFGNFKKFAKLYVQALEIERKRNE